MSGWLEGFCNSKAGLRLMRESRTIRFFEGLAAD